MPTLNDDWEVQAVMQYRVVYGIEQWLVKWKGYGDDRNTWEPWENLEGSGQVEAEVRQVREKSLPTVAPSPAVLEQLKVVTLKAALQARGCNRLPRTKAELLALWLQCLAV